MCGYVEGQACADLGARTPIGVSGNFLTLSKPSTLGSQLFPPPHGGTASCCSVEWFTRLKTLLLLPDVLLDPIDQEHPDCLDRVPTVPQLACEVIQHSHPLILGHGVADVVQSPGHLTAQRLHQGVLVEGCVCLKAWASVGLEDEFNILVLWLASF